MGGAVHEGANTDEHPAEIVTPTLEAGRPFAAQVHRPPLLEHWLSVVLQEIFVLESLPHYSMGCLPREGNAIMKDACYYHATSIRLVLDLKRKKTILNLQVEENLEAKERTERTESWKPPEQGEHRWLLYCRNMNDHCRRIDT